MKKRILTLMAAFLIMTFFTVNLTAQNDYAGYKKSPSGMYYKVHKKGENDQKASVGDILTLDMYYTNSKDSVIFDSRNSKQVFMIPLALPLYPGDINEAMSTLSIGDSTTFLLDADSFFIKTVGLPELPNFIEKGSKLYFTIALKNITKEEEYQRLLEEQKIAEKEKIEVLKQEESQKIQNYLEEKGIKTKARESGLYYILIEEGSGPQASVGKTVKVHYTGTFLNGDKFDSSLDRGEPIEFVLGQGRVIKGWDEGIALMKVGEKAKFIIPSEIAYGERGGGAIPPVTPLVFEVELIEVK